MPGLDGLELLDLLAERVPSADVIMMTAYDDMHTVVSAMRAGAVEFLVKPLDLHELRRTVDRLFADRAGRKETNGVRERAASAGCARRARSANDSDLQADRPGGDRS
jgi:DNA-binding NtrC family response regulator